MPSLDRLLARNLGCSRGQARDLLAREAAHLPREIPVDALPLEVRLGPREIVLHDSFHLMLNKPAGCVTALHDQSHPAAAAHIRGAPLAVELRPVGRLDLDTTGLLLWTTDGDWLHRLIRPREQLPRGYHAALARPFLPLPADLRLRDGRRPNVLDLRVIEPDALHPGLLRPQDACAFAAITIAGGAYHEVRRIFAALGSHVLALCRVSFGALTLPQDLAPGSWRPIIPTDVD
jgi:16S rRNA pseudouridine516 synthase